MFNKKEYMINYRKKNKKHISLKEKLRYLRNRNKIKSRTKKYYLKNREAYLNKMRKYYRKNKTKLLNQAHDYRKNHKVERNKYLKNKKRTNISFRILCNLRINLNTALKRNTKYGTTITLLGCSVEFLRLHLESKFKPGMSWKNYGKWHIDHIRPCASFDLSKSSEQKKCFHYSNLQPLWAIDNLRKSDTY